MSPNVRVHAIRSTDSPWTAVILFAFMGVTLVSIVVLGILGEGAFEDRESHTQTTEFEESAPPARTKQAGL